MFSAIFFNHTCFLNYLKMIRYRKLSAKMWNVEVTILNWGNVTCTRKNLRVIGSTTCLSFLAYCHFAGCLYYNHFSSALLLLGNHKGGLSVGKAISTGCQAADLVISYLDTCSNAQENSWWEDVLHERLVLLGNDLTEFARSLWTGHDYHFHLFKFEHQVPLSVLCILFSFSFYF